MEDRKTRHSPAQPATTDVETLGEAYARIRRQTLDVAAPLSPEDQQVQSMPDASPTKWHLAHVTWFFEAFVLADALHDFTCFDAQFWQLFNSYYEAVGRRHPRAERGLLTRPSLSTVLAYGAHVDELMAALIDDLDDDRDALVIARIHLGLHHEQQHQELLLTDILHAFAQNPLRPAYRPGLECALEEGHGDINGTRRVAMAGGVVEIGHVGREFAFDNESPRHCVYLQPFRLSTRPVSNGEWRAFIDDDGYRRPELWLADGWATAQAHGWTSPLYWSRTSGNEYEQMTLRGPLPLDDAAPVCHVSYYEADAFARWAGCRLPTEAEWETAAAATLPYGNTLGGGALRPRPSTEGSEGILTQLFGDVWEWTQSAYHPYPGFRPQPGAIGEYNGKFMCNQIVLRGGSCVTPDGHIRATYRNFFYPHQRWQFSGLRLAEDG